MTEPSKNANTIAVPSGGCPVEMDGGRPCGRAIHSAPVYDQTPVCLMHSHDPEKSDEEFQKEIEAILGAAVAEDGVADFTGFVFRSVNNSTREFKPRCVFAGAMFTQKADFSEATFTQTADFRRAMFTQHADFSRATFTQDAYFTDATFRQETLFKGATFAQGADFLGATFTQGADFREAMFTRDATFLGARFTKEAFFGEAAFTQVANFNGATFTGVASFWRTKFFEEAEFRETKFRGHDKDKKARADDLIPGPVFCLAEFSQPEKILFYKTYLGQALFHNCDVSKVVFSSVEWRQRKGNGKRMVLEEEVAVEDAEALWPKEGSRDERDYALIAELYQQLKKNYDDKKDYWTAGDFHYGELEMKRLHSKRRNHFARWGDRNLGLVAWYKYASEYGES